VALMEEWTQVQADVASLGLRDSLADDWRERHNGRDFDDLSAGELRAWLDHVRERVAEAEDAVAEERAEAEAQ
jgi:hypothetical protein